MQSQAGFEHVKTLQDIIENFDKFSESKKNRSRIFSNTEKGRENLQKYKQLQDASNSVLQSAQEQKAKEALLNGYKLIMGIREALELKHINYGIFYTGVNDSKQQQLLMGTASIESLISQGHLNKSMSIVLEQTGAQIRTILKENSSNSVNNNFIDLLARKNNQKVWDVLTQVSEKLNKIKTEDGKRKYYYFYGQLVEALIDLEDKDLNTENIYKALVQGQNTISFEKQGDVQLSIIEEEISKIYEIQAKTFAAQGTSDDDVKTIRIISLSNIINTLTRLENAFNQQDIIKALNDEFTNTSKSSQGQIAKLASIDKDIEKEIKALIDQILKSG